MKQTVLKDKQTILFIGDSITDCGRREPAGKPYGYGYVAMFNDMLLTREPDKRITLVNRGIGGNTVDDLRSRWHEDALSHKPDWLSVMIGINDVHQHLGSRDGKRLPPPEFRAIYDGLLALTRKKLPRCSIILLEPFYISRDKMDRSYRARILTKLTEYIDTVHYLSRKHRTRLVKIHELFQRQLEYHHPDVYCPEPVHPNNTGHLFIAEAVYQDFCRQVNGSGRSG